MAGWAERIKSNVFFLLANPKKKDGQYTAANNKEHAEGENEIWDNHEH